MRKLWLLFVTVTLTALCSCEYDTAAVTIPYSLVITEDLYRFVVPTIEYYENGYRPINKKDNKVKIYKSYIIKKRYEMLPVMTDSDSATYDGTGLMHSNQVPIIRIDFRVKYTNLPMLPSKVTVKYQLPKSPIDIPEKAKYDFGHWLERNSAIINVNGMIQRDNYTNVKPYRIQEVPVERLEDYIKELINKQDSTDTMIRDSIKVTIDPSGYVINDVVE